MKRLWGPQHGPRCQKYNLFWQGANLESQQEQKVSPNLSKVKW